MDPIGTQGYVILGIIVVIGGVIAYAIWLSKRCRKDKELLQEFLKCLSASYEKSWNLHHTYELTKSQVAEIIRTQISMDVERPFKKAIAGMRRFPSRAFKFFSKEPATNRFISVMFDATKESSERWRHLGISLDELFLDFMDEVREALHQEMEKHAAKYVHGRSDPRVYPGVFLKRGKIKRLKVKGDRPGSLFLYPYLFIVKYFISKSGFVKAKLSGNSTGKDVDMAKGRKIFKIAGMLISLHN